MSENENIELVRRAFEAFNARDLEALLEAVHSEIEFLPVTRALANEGRPYRGHDGIRKYFRDVAEVWQELRVTPRTYVELGDHVAAYGRVYGRATDGTVVDSPADWIWTIRDRKILWACVYAKRDEALRAIQEPAPEVQTLIAASISGPAGPAEAP
jgi:ketosteroid isomerase-like protein